MRFSFGVQVVFQNFKRLNTANHRTPRRVRNRNADTQEAQRRLRQNDTAKAQRHRYDKLGHKVGEKVFENLSRRGKTAGFRRKHILLFTKGQDLTTYKTSRTCPTEEGQYEH